jgi:hypothetical protein
MEYVATNRKSAKKLVETEGSPIDFIHNTKDGKDNIFFKCGSIVGGISDKIKAAHKAGTLTIDQMEYAEVSKNGGKAVPVLMMVSKANVVASFK